MKNEILCVACGDFFTGEDISTASNGKTVCFMCEKKYEMKVNKVYSLEKDIKKKEITSYIQENLFSTTLNDGSEIVDKVTTLSLEDYVFAIRLIPAESRKEIYSSWLRELIEFHLYEKENKNMSQVSSILAFITWKDEDFQENFYEEKYWSKLNHTDFYKRTFIDTAYKFYKKYNIFKEFFEL